jgi:uncharacterized protein YqjF (DUF2071 family)
MPKTFLTAQWRNLVFANYPVPPEILLPYLPAFTEPDPWNGSCYVSLVGFMFEQTKVKGIAFPFHQNFEEFNLRFYVRYPDGGEWKRGVVFVKEIVPKPLISTIANVLYGEKYVSLPMRHRWNKEPDETQTVEYSWKMDGQWDYIRVNASGTGSPLVPGSHEEFITEHYWGYTRMGEKVTSEYEVVHPRWNIFPVNRCEIGCSAEKLYGPQFAACLAGPPETVFLAEGSPVAVKEGRQIRASPGNNA